MKQRTLQNSFSLKGKGLHTGMDITITFLPAPENHGYKIQRIDLEDHPIIDAVAENVIETQRGTVVAKKEIAVSTIEHAMAALFGFEIDNCLIQVNAPEFPILDGSARYYAEAITKAGIIEQEAEREYFIIKNKIEVKDDATGSSLLVLPDEDFSINTLISFDSPVLNNQFASLDNLQNFASEIANSRTFVFVREIEPLVKNNLIKGGDLDNAIVIYDQKTSQEELDRLADLMGVPHKHVDELGYINNNPLVFDNEPARHKLLDVIGDLSLCGRFIKGRVIAERPGHKANTSLAKKMCKAITQAEREDVRPDVDTTAEPLMDVNKVRALLPHRPPFLLVDKIYEVTDDIVIGCKNVTMNEPFFVGHFPEEPVMPGVLIVEAMAQCGGILVLNQVEDPENYSTYFVKIDGIKFRHKVVPGDTLVFKLVKIAPIRRGIVTMRGYAFVGKTLVCEVGEFMAQVAKTKK